MLQMLTIHDNNADNWTKQRQCRQTFTPWNCINCICAMASILERSNLSRSSRTANLSAAEWAKTCLAVKAPSCPAHAETRQWRVHDAEQFHQQFGNINKTKKCHHDNEIIVTFVSLLLLVVLLGFSFNWSTSQQLLQAKPVPKVFW